MSLVGTIDSNLRIYYKSQNKPYEHAFAQWCDDNGYDDDSIQLEIDNLDDEMPEFVEFDVDFPYPPGTDQDETSRKAVCLEILLKCANGSTNFAIYMTTPICMSITTLHVSQIMLHLNIYSYSRPIYRY